MAESRTGVLWDGDNFDDYQHFLYICMRGLTEGSDLGSDGRQRLATEARKLAQPEYEAWVAREAARYVGAAQQILDLAFVRFLIESEGGVAPGAPDGPPIENGS